MTPNVQLYHTSIPYENLSTVYLHLMTNIKDSRFLASSTSSIGMCRLVHRTVPYYTVPYATRWMSHNFSRSLGSSAFRHATFLAPYTVLSALYVALQPIVYTPAHLNSNIEAANYMSTQYIQYKPTRTLSLSTPTVPQEQLTTFLFNQHLPSHNRPHYNDAFLASSLLSIIPYSFCALLSSPFFPCTRPPCPVSA